MKSSISILFLLLSFNLSAHLDTTNHNMTIIVHTPTNNLQESLDFYTKLNYEVISKADPTLVTDGKVIIEINPDRFSRAGIKMYKDLWASEVDQLSQLTKVHKTSDGHLLNDFNGCWIYLVESNPTFDSSNKPSASGATGNFQGLSLESADMEKSIEIWKALGFNITMGALDKGFLVLSHNNGFGVSLMQPQSCPHLFFNPSMTFFNGKENLGIIEKIRKANIPITEEITYFNKEGIVDNIIIRDPGGYGFFIFSD